jgi:hypothetical protein
MSSSEGVGAELGVRKRLDELRLKISQASIIREKAPGSTSSAKGPITAFATSA